MSLASVFAGIGTLEKIVPVVEAIGAQIGPLVETEVSDGKEIWGDVVKAFNDFKGAVALVKAAASSATGTPPAK
jgi:hypothetical protein